MNLPKPEVRYDATNESQTRNLIMQELASLRAAIRSLGGGVTLPIAESDVTDLVTDLAAKAPLASPALTGNPTAPTPAAADNDTSIATTAFVQGELAAKAPLASPTFTGTPAAPTPSAADSTTKIATTAFVQGELAAKAPLASPALTGTPTAPTPAAADSSTKIATTAFVQGELAGVGGGAWTTVIKTASEVRTSSTTLTADDDLIVGLSASSKYHIRARIFYNIVNATMDFKFDNNYTGTIADISSHRRYSIAGAGTGSDNEFTVVLDTIIPSTSLVATTSGDGWVEFDVYIQTTTAGTFQFRWAQVTSDIAGCTVKAGSYLEWMEVA